MASIKIIQGIDNPITTILKMSDDHPSEAILDLNFIHSPIFPGLKLVSITFKVSISSLDPEKRLEIR